MAFEDDDPPTPEQIAFTVLVITQFNPELWDGWHHSLGNNDSKLDKLRALARLRSAADTPVESDAIEIA